MSKLLKYKNINGTVEFSLEDNCLHGKLCGVNGVFMYEGQTIEELKAAFNEAVDDYLEFCKTEDIPVHKEYSGILNIRLGKTLHRDLASLSSAKGVSLNKLITDKLSELDDGTCCK